MKGGAADNACRQKLLGLCYQVPTVEVEVRLVPPALHLWSAC
jgi:hypothetical protein